MQTNLASVFGLSFSLFPSFSQFLGCASVTNLSAGPNSGEYDLSIEYASSVKLVS